MKIHHVAITIPKDGEQTARNFYCNILGLREIEKPESLRDRGGFWLQLDGSQIHVSIEDGVDRMKTKAHVAFEVRNLEEIKKSIIECGLKPLDGISIPGFDRFEFRDPFGNRWECLAKTF
jgi:catechol 2,3-dioxygenase-like lactoylglutathione lyase family enzyme